MARLILLNGPPGCGKSTMAQMYVNDHPLALNLDIDRVRSLLGGWRADPQAAGLLARAIALAAARVHLSSGHDVIVAQHLGRAQFIEQLERLAQEVGADFRELVLLDDKDQALTRFAERTRAGSDPAHLEAQELLDHAGGQALASIAIHDSRHVRALPRMQRQGHGCCRHRMQTASWWTGTASVPDAPRAARLR